MGLKTAGSFRLPAFQWTKGGDISPEWFGLAVLGSMLWWGLCYLFYHSLWPGLASLPAFLAAYLPQVGKRLEEKRRSRLRGQFQDAAQMLSSLLLAGYSLENAMEGTRRQLADMLGEKAEMCVALSQMCRQLQVGISAEEAWEGFGASSGVEEIRLFARLLLSAKRSGSSLPDLLQAVVQQLAMKVQIESQIEAMLAGKRLELAIMMAMPAAIIVYVSLTSPDLLRVMYEGFTGRAVMTACLAVYVLAIWISRRITEAA